MRILKFPFSILCSTVTEMKTLVESWPENHRLSQTGDSRGGGDAAGVV